MCYRIYVRPGKGIYNVRREMSANSRNNAKFFDYSNKGNLLGSPNVLSQIMIRRCLPENSERAKKE